MKLGAWLFKLVKRVNCENTNTFSVRVSKLRKVSLAQPLAPASRRAPACVNPRPRAPPETSTTLSTRLNSGSPFCVPGASLALWVFPGATGATRDDLKAEHEENGLMAVVLPRRSGLRKTNFPV